MKSPLIIIDVQDRFIDRLSDDKGEYVNHVLTAVRRAKEQKRFVFLVQYARYGRTTRRVRLALTNYSQKGIIIKHRDDGAQPIHNRLKAFPKQITSLIICGVNLDACVRDTVESLTDIGYRCSIVQKATCNTWAGSYTPADDGFKKRVSNSSQIRLMKV